VGKFQCKYVGLGQKETGCVFVACAFLQVGGLCIESNQRGTVVTRMGFKQFRVERLQLFCRNGGVGAMCFNLVRHPIVKAMGGAVHRGRKTPSVEVREMAALPHSLDDPDVLEEHLFPPGDIFVRVFLIPVTPSFGKRGRR